ncbi:hypothetical protein ES708_23966 [subsurface metagenome]
MSDAPEAVEYKGKIIGRIGDCTLISVPTPDGGEHLEATCASKEARDHLAAILEQEAILRVNPRVILEEAPDITPERPPVSPAAAAAAAAAPEPEFEPAHPET